MNFSPARSGLPDRCTVSSLVIDPQHPGTLYTTLNVTSFASPPPGELIYRNLFKSTDGGGFWVAVNPAGLPNDLGLDELAIDPQNSRMMYGTNFPGRGVFRSTDAGANWSAMNSGLTSLWVTTLAIDPLTSTVYAGTGGGGVFAYTPVSVSALTFDPTTVRLGESFTARFSGTNLTGQLLFRCPVPPPGQLSRRSRPRLAARTVGSAYDRKRHRNRDLDHHGRAGASEPRRPQRRLLSGLRHSDRIAVLKRQDRFLSVELRPSISEFLISVEQMA